MTYTGMLKLLEIFCLFLFLVIMGTKHSVDAFNCSPRSSQLRVKRQTIIVASRNTITDLPIRTSNAIIFVETAAAWKRGIITIKHFLKRVRAVYRFLKPEMKMGSCFTKYFHLNPFGLRRRRRSTNNLHITGPVHIESFGLRRKRRGTTIKHNITGPDLLLDHLELIANNLNAIHLSIEGVLNEIKKTNSLNGINMMKLKSDIVKNNNIKPKIDDSKNTIQSVKDTPLLPFHNNVIVNIATGLFESLFGVMPSEVLLPVVSAIKNNILWKSVKWIKLLIGKIISNKLLLCSREYVGKRVWDWVDGS